MIVTAGSMPRITPIRNPINRGNFTGLRNDNWELYSLYVHVLKWDWTVEECNLNNDGEAFITLKSPDDEGSVIIVLGAT